MTYDEIKNANIAYDESKFFTWNQLALDKLELLKKAASDEISLPDSVWEKLNTLCRKTIDDYHLIVPDSPIPPPLNLEIKNDAAKKNMRIKLLIAFLGVTPQILNLLFPQQPTITNNYYITVEQSQILHDDMSAVLATLSDKPEELR